MSGKIINFQEKREEKLEKDKIVYLDEYRNKRKTSGMSEREFKSKYMKDSLRDLYGDKIIDLFNKNPDDFPDEPA